MTKTPRTIRLSKLIAVAQLAIGALTILTYFSLRSAQPASPVEFNLEDLYAIFFLMFAAISIVNLGLWIWEGFIAFKTKEFDWQLLYLALAVVLLWGCIIAEVFVFPLRLGAA